MKKLPLIILVFCVLFSSYFLWKANTYTKWAGNAQAETMKIQEARSEIELEVERLKQQALANADEERLIRNKVEEIQRELEGCRK